MAENSIPLPPDLRTELETVAEFLGWAEAGSPEWDAFREGRIGGSEVAAIAGESKYESAYSLWAKKLSKIPSNREDNEPMYWGRALEPVIIDRFERDHAELTIYRDVGTWANKQHPHMLANPDALYRTADGELGVIEVKTARFADDWAEGVPRYYETQVQWYLATLGLNEAYVIVLISGSDYREYTIEADKTWQDYDQERVAEFMHCLERDEKPAWDGSEATLQTVRKQHPDIDSEASVELGDLGVYYANALAKLDDAKAEARMHESAVLDAMGKAKTALIYDQPMFIRTARGQGAPFIIRKRGQ